MKEKHYYFAEKVRLISLSEQGYLVSHCSPAIYFSNLYLLCNFTKLNVPTKGLVIFWRNERTLDGAVARQLQRCTHKIYFLGNSQNMLVRTHFIISFIYSKFRSWVMNAPYVLFWSLDATVMWLMTPLRIQVFRGIVNSGWGNCRNEWSLVSCIPNGLMGLFSLYLNHWAVATSSSKREVISWLAECERLRWALVPPRLSSKSKHNI